MSDREPSRGEVAVWKQLRLLRNEGFSFRREQSVGAFRADFVCFRRRLIVEVDGGVHDLRGRNEQDARRDDWLKAESYRVLRFRDSESLSEANWLDVVRKALLAQPEAPYRLKGSLAREAREIVAGKSSTLPLEGGGQGGGESVGRDVSSVRANIKASSVAAPLTPPLTPPPLGAGRPVRGAVACGTPRASSDGTLPDGEFA